MRPAFRPGIDRLESRALLSGAAPALRATRATTLARLRSGFRGSIGTRRDARVRGALVAAQFAVALACARHLGRDFQPGDHLR